MKLLKTGIDLDVKKLPISMPTQELFGHVTLVEGYAVTTYTGCHALVALRDQPGVTVALGDCVRWRGPSPSCPLRTR